MDQRDKGRLRSQTRLRDSCSPPRASVAKLKLQMGSKKLRNTEKTIQLEKTKNPERSSTACQAPRTASAPDGGIQEGISRVCHNSASHHCSKVSPVPRGDRQ